MKDFKLTLFLTFLLFIVFGGGSIFLTLSARRKNLPPPTPIISPHLSPISSPSATIVPKVSPPPKVSLTLSPKIPPKSPPESPPGG